MPVMAHRISPVKQIEQIELRDWIEDKDITSPKGYKILINPFRGKSTYPMTSL